MERHLGVPLDSTTIPQTVLNIISKERSNLFPWNGQFSPQLLEALLTTFAKDAVTVLDPFVGSGTVLHEAAKLGKEVFGVEINPAAFKMAQTYRLMGLPTTERMRLLGQVDERVLNLLPEAPLFSDGTTKQDVDEENVLTALSGTRDEWERLVTEALVILMDFHNGCTAAKLSKTWRRLRATVEEFESAHRPIHVMNTDARKLPIPDRSIDFVLTSPPYINVFNYHQQYRRSAEAIGWNLLEVAKAEIGSNRKHRGNRLLTVIQYCLDMAQVLTELGRVCRPSGRVVLVVGRESNVRKTQFYNGDIVTNLAVRSLGWSCVLRQERAFMNRFGDTITEDILHFVTGQSTQGQAKRVEPKEIAREVLTEALQRVPDEARDDLEAALSKIESVKPSPLYDQSAASTVTKTKS
jgi:SAM-dependent methyltransferase